MKDLTGAITCVIASVALLMSIHLQNPWVALIAAGLFLFVWFPKWRGKLYRLVEKHVGRRRDRDNC